MERVDELAPEEALRAIRRFARAYREDASLRGRIDAGDREVAVECGLPVPPDTAVKVVENTEAVFHLVMPPDPNAPLSEKALRAAAGGEARDATLGYPILCFSGFRWDDPNTTPSPGG